MRTITFYPNKVHYNNQLNDVMIKEIKNIYPQLLPYIGKLILLSDGKNSRKFNINYLRTEPEPLKTGDYAHNHVCYLDISNTSMWLKISLCFSGGSYENNTYYCNYIDKSVYIGELSGGVLTKVQNPDDIIEDWKLCNNIDIETERAKVNQYNQLMQQAEQVKNSFAFTQE